MALKRKVVAEVDEDVLYPADDGVPMDDGKHGLNANMLRESLELWQTTVAFIGVNQFIYYEHGNPRKNVGPDFFVVKDIPYDHERDCWRVWNEGGRLPDVIIEFVSKTSGHKDRVKNFAIYRDLLRVPNYLICDNRRRYTLDGFRLQGDEYVPLQPDKSGRLWCEAVGLQLGFDQKWLRWFDADGRLLPTAKELATLAENRVALAENRVALAEDRATLAEDRATLAEHRALQATAQTAQLKAELERLRRPPASQD